jgi:hypothetical protein
MPEKQFFVGFIFFLVWILAGTLSIYLGARLAHIERNTPWRSFFAAFVSGFLLLFAFSVTGDSIGTNPFIWIVIYAAIVLPILKWVIRATFKKIVIPWVFAVLCLGIALLIRHILLGIP